MNMPFNQTEFFSVFSTYNQTVYPAQLLLLLAGMAGIFLLASKIRRKHRWITAILAISWTWVGAAYHFAFFSAINKAATVFGGLFILQGMLFFYETFFRDRIEYQVKGGFRHIAGYIFILFGLIIYPLIGYFSHYHWLHTISFGLPCPTTIVTFGFLLLTTRNFPKYLLIIPFAWAIIGTGAAINFGIYQDYVMLASALLAVALLLFRKRQPDTSVNTQ